MPDPGPDAMPENGPNLRFPLQDGGMDAFVWTAEDCNGGYDFIADFALGRDILDFSGSGLEIGELLSSLETGGLTMVPLDDDALRLTLNPGDAPGGSPDGLTLEVAFQGGAEQYADFVEASRSHSGETEAARALLEAMMTSG
jgi:hypothetical protein